MEIRTNKPVTIEQRLKSLEDELRATRQENERLRKRPSRNKKSWKIFIKPSLYGLGLAVAIGVSTLGYTTLKQPPDPVPVSIRRAVNFDVYYPVQSELPSGFTLNTKSFTLEDHAAAVAYTISTANGVNLVVSDQAKPSASEMSLFYKTRMPLTIPVPTKVGMAAIGGLNSETVVSLPTNTNAWILMTAPLEFNQTQLKQVVQAIVRAE